MRNTKVRSARLLVLGRGTPDGHVGAIAAGPRAGGRCGRSPVYPRVRFVMINYGQGDDVCYYTVGGNMWGVVRLLWVKTVVVVQDYYL